MKRLVLVSFVPIVWFAMSCLLVLACGGPSTGAKNDTGPNEPTGGVTEPMSAITGARLYTGPDGIRAEVVEFQGGKKALIKVSGSRGDVEGKVLPYRIEEDGSRLNYITEVRGRDHYTLVQSRSRYDDSGDWRLYLGAKYPNGVAVGFDEKGSKNIDAAAIYREHQAQAADGSLARLQRFDRQTEQKEEEDELARSVALAADKCKFEVTTTIAWPTITDDDLKTKSVASFCDTPIDVMRNLCENSETARAFFKASVRKVECRISDKRSLTIANNTLTWVEGWKEVNADEYARNNLLEQKYEGKTLRNRMALEKTVVCADDKKKRTIVVAPEGGDNPGVLYSDGKAFHRARTTEMSGDGWFYDPRFFNPGHNSSFRGIDFRSWSRIDVDKNSGRCVLTCGTRSTEIPRATGKDAAAIVDSMVVEPDLLPYEPYVLARDRQGTYYYVERSTKPGEERYFRLYIGRLGGLKLQKMKDIVSDSEGEIFSSKAGDLRLVLDRSEATWIAGKNANKLKMVPVEANLQMIYNNLGVYTGMRLGTPCDDYGVN